MGKLALFSNLSKTEQQKALSKDIDVTQEFSSKTLLGSYLHALDKARQNNITATARPIKLLSFEPGPDISDPLTLLARQQTTASTNLNLLLTS